MSQEESEHNEVDGMKKGVDFIYENYRKIKTEVSLFGSLCRRRKVQEEDNSYQYS